MNKQRRESGVDKMILYKNVDICDLEPIVKNGILSIDECGNNNWDEGKRANNDTFVVYLFSPIGKQNSFPNYGAALLEVDCDAKENQMKNNDSHKNDYREYIISKVLPTQIKRIIIPKIFRNHIEIPEGLNITWCEIEADYYGDSGLEKCTESIWKQFAKTAPLMNSTEFNFFRGVTEKRTMIDLHNIEYVF